MSFRGLLRLALAVGILAITIGGVGPKSADPVQPPTPASQEFIAPRLPESSPAGLEAAAAIRQEDYAAARRLLAPLTRGQGPDDRSMRLLLGLYALQAGEFEDASLLLASSIQPSGELEDWRLFALADAAQAIDDLETADTALEALLGDYPKSPIRAVALQRAVEIAADHEQWERALGWVEQARREPLPKERAEAIEEIAWQAAIALEDVTLQQDTARYLLIEHPGLADELEVVESQAIVGGGDTELAEILTVAELQRRATRLLQEDRPARALETLDSISDSSRELAWILLRAEALTSDHQGVSALRLLENKTALEPEIQIELLWQRATASRDAAKVRRGRTNLQRTERDRMRQASFDYFARVAALASEPERVANSLERQFDILSLEDDTFEQAMPILLRLLAIDPDDWTGAAYIWRLGWQSYSRRDYPVAIGYWSELQSMYPLTTYGRSGRYWTARSHQALGHVDRSRQIYQEISAAEFTDFYSRHASARLGSKTAGSDLAAPSRPTEPWPQDPVLARALWLSDHGLDQFGLYELEGLEGLSDRRGYCAAKATLLSRNGQTRDSIAPLVCAFPALGKTHQDVVPEAAQRMYFPLAYHDIIGRRARERSLSPYLVFAMIRQESAFDAGAKSWAGARGLMQLMPATGRELARRLGLSYSTEKLSDPDFSVHLGTTYFRQVLDMFDGNETLALAGYNGGPYRIKKLWRQAGTNPEMDRFVEGLALEETKTYVKRILLFKDSYRQLYEGQS